MRQTLRELTNPPASQSSLSAALEARAKEVGLIRLVLPQEFLDAFCRVITSDPRVGRELAIDLLWALHRELASMGCTHATET